MHTFLFARQSVRMRVTDVPANLASYAAEFGVDMIKCNAFITRKSHCEQLAEAAAEMCEQQGTPAFVINDRHFAGRNLGPG